MPDTGKPAASREREGSITLHLFGRTDVGQIREHNEDSFLIADLTRQSRPFTDTALELEVGHRGTLLGVCDGMGGAAAGEVASRLAVEIIYERLASGDPPKDHDDLARRLVNAVEDAGVRIFSEARADRTRRGMGTTATIATLIDNRLFVAQVGDSRGYVLRNGALFQVTRDQSLVNQLIEAGQLTEEEAETFEHNNIILQALGTAETVQVDLTYTDLRRGDVLLFCSDGLSGMIRTEEIREVLLRVEAPEQACTALIEHANLAGGHDNITVIVARVGGDGVPEHSADDVPVGYLKYALPDGHDGTVPSPPHDTNARELLLDSEPPTDAEVRPGEQGFAGLPLEPAPRPTPSDSEPPSARPVYNSDEDPVEIPIAGPAPSVVGLMVLGAMVLVALAGFVLLR
jgi:protein phosphatase